MVTPRFAPYVGGVEQHVLEVARRLAEAGCQVGVLTADPSGDLPKAEAIGGVHIRRVRAWPRRRDYYVAPSIYRTILASRQSWDVIHVQSYHTFVAPLAMLAARRIQLPYVLTFHGGGHSSRTRQLLRRSQWRMLMPLVRGARRLIAIAEFEVDLYGKAFRVPRERFEVIPNGVDMPPREPSSAAGSVIASVGRLERYKGHQRILAAMPTILAARPDAHLWIAGMGPYENSLREQADALGVADHVEIRAIAAEERERMAEELGRVALVVLLSEYETQPLAILEAIALGRPALVADTSGLSELARRGLAVAIPLASRPDDVAAAVIRQLERPQVPPREPLPTWDECADSLRRLYERVVTEPLRA